MDLRELVRIVWKRRLLVLLVVVLCGGLGTAFALSRSKTYESTATISITPDPSTQGLVPSDYLSGLLATYAQSVDSELVLGPAEGELGRQISGSVSGTAEEGTGILRITAQAGVPGTAQSTAAAVADSFLDTIADDEPVRAELINPAARPSEPVQPRPPLIIATSIVVGFGAAILLALGFDRYRRRVETAADLADLAQLPLIGQIPRSRGLARAKPRLVWDDRAYIDLQESFRSLRTNLSFVADENRVLQVTSATEAQGKSTLVANLGLTFAQMDVNTLIIDADLRRPVQNEIFNVNGARGVSLVGPRGGFPNPQRTRFPNLSVLPSGPALEDPTEVLHVRFGRVLHSLREDYDLLLIDSPPALPVSDARIMAPWSDAVILVVAAGKEKPSSLAHAIEELELAGAEMKGFVLNQATVVGGRYGYYYRPPGGLRAEAVAPAAEPVPAAQRIRKTGSPG